MKKPKVRGIFAGAKGQRVFNILYSIGASIVILGALFKIQHAAGADFMLIVGMGTEAVIFFLSAFDEQQMGSGEESQQVADAQSGVASQQHDVLPSAQPVQPACVPVTPVSVNPVAVPVGGAVNPEAMDRASVETEEYVRKLAELNETLGRMQASLAQNLQGLNAMYELQLRDAGSQLDSVNKVHHETEQMRETIGQLNQIYERMLAAMQNK